MTYKGLIRKSRTLDAAAFVGALGVVVQLFPMIKDQLGDYYGWIFIGLSALFWYLREITKTPVGEK